VDLDAVTLRVETENYGTSARRPVQGEEQPYGRGLACPVRAEEAEALVRLDAKAEIHKSAGHPVGLREIEGLDGRSHRRDSTRPSNVVGLEPGVQGIKTTLEMMPRTSGQIWTAL